MTDHGVQPIVEASAGLESMVTELYEKSGNSGLSREQFAAVLKQVAAKYLPADASARQIAELYASLRVEELALARACAAGQERAWEVFMARYREKLYDIAAYIAKENSAARELADSLYADLYGTTTRDGQRVSKLASYTGRGSLEGWLRTVMAQEFVNRFRRQRRLVSLDEESEDGAQFAALIPSPPPRSIPELKPRPMKSCPDSPRRSDSFWHLIIWTVAPWPRLRARSRCMSPPSAASSINWPGRCANKLWRRSSAKA